MKVTNMSRLLGIRFTVFEYSYIMTIKRSVFVCKQIFFFFFVIFNRIILRPEESNITRTVGFTALWCRNYCCYFIYFFTLSQCTQCLWLNIFEEKIYIIGYFTLIEFQIDQNYNNLHADFQIVWFVPTFLFKLCTA